MSVIQNPRSGFHPCRGFAIRMKRGAGGGLDYSYNAEAVVDEAAGDLGWAEGASQSFGARLPGQPERAHPNRIPAAVRAGSESRGVSVGLAQTARAGQRLPQRPERVAPERPQQAQERSEATLDHCHLLDAGYALVMS